MSQSRPLPPDGTPKLVKQTDISPSPSTVHDITEVIHHKPVGDASEQAHSLIYQTDSDHKSDFYVEARNVTSQERPGRWHIHSWISEIVAIIASAASAIAIPVILGIYHHSPVPKFPWDLSINAIVSVISTIAKSSLLYAMSAALGHDKWD